MQQKNLQTPQNVVNHTNNNTTKEKDMDRTRGIGGSDATRIMRGDWLSLYNEKVGLTQPEDLSNVFNLELQCHGGVPNVRRGD